MLACLGIGIRRTCLLSGDVVVPGGSAGVLGQREVVGERGRRPRAVPCLERQPQSAVEIAPLVHGQALERGFVHDALCKLDAPIGQRPQVPQSNQGGEPGFDVLADHLGQDARLEPPPGNGRDLQQLAQWRLLGIETSGHSAAHGRR